MKTNKKFDSRHVHKFTSKSGATVTGRIVAYDPDLDLHCVELSEQSEGFNRGVYDQGERRWIRIQKDPEEVNENLWDIL